MIRIDTLALTSIGEVDALIKTVVLHDTDGKARDRYETYVIGGEHHGEVTHCTTRDQALTCHELMVKREKKNDRSGRDAD